MSLIELLTPNYEKSKEVKLIQQSLEMSTDAAKNSKDDLFNHLFVNTVKQINSVARG